jgi:hypothetical protein
MNKKIGLITTHFAINYGATLQAYALHKAINNLNHTCEVVDYSPSEQVYGKEISYNFSSLKESVNSLFIFFNRKYQKDMASKINSFDLFVRENFNLSTDKYSSYQDLKANILEYEVLICGSDQIWNLNLINDPVFFLEFTEELPKTRFISYAASIAEELTKEKYQELVKRVSHFSAISIREKNDACKLRQLSKKKINWVLDPVFLLTKSDWRCISKDVDIDEPYILCYEVSSSKIFSEALRIFKKKSGLRLVCINSRPYNKHNADVMLTDVSPQEFIGLIKNASFVFTSSFHAVVFSIVFERQFFVVANKLRSSRHESILNALSLESRLGYDLEDCIDLNEVKGIDYDKVREKLLCLREASLAYLNLSIKGQK